MAKILGVYKRLFSSRSIVLYILLHQQRWSFTPAKLIDPASRHIVLYAIVVCFYWEYVVSLSGICPLHGGSRAPFSFYSRPRFILQTKLIDCLPLL